MSYSLGVDLGTTFVAAALATATKIEMFTLGDRSVVAPALVYFREDGTLITGEAASLRAVSSPDRVGREFKRRLGNPTPMILGGQPQTIPALLGTLLRDVVQKVIETEGEPPDRVMLTYPANWGPFRRALFEEVARHAELVTPLMVTEPEAAAAHYIASRPLADGETVAVYDLGGGTFDATVLRKQPGGVEVLGTPEGIERLGGVDFDEAILTYVDYTAGGVLSELDMGDPQTTVALARLRQDCILAKEALSVDTETIIPVFLPGRHFDVPLTRSDFEDMVRAPIESTIGALSRTLESARVDLADLSAVLLVGGSSRIPLIARMVSAELGRPTVVNSHPKYTVALGAARLAAQATAQAAAQGQSRPPRSRPAIDTRLPGNRHPGPGNRRAGRGRSRSPLVLAGLIGLVVFVALIGINRVQVAPQPGSDPPGVPVPVAAPTLVPAVPIPAVGATIPVGKTPLFVAVSPDGQRAYVANGNAHVVTVLDTASNQVTATIPIPAGPPRFLAFTPDSRTLYVTIFDDHRKVHLIDVVDTASNAVVATIPQHDRPFLPAVAPDGRLLYVPNRDNAAVSVVSTATNKVISQIHVSPNPNWVAFSRDGSRAYISSRESNAISVIDTATLEVLATVPVGISPYSIAVSPNRPLIANVNLGSNDVTVIDTNTLKVLSTIPVGKNPRDVCWSPDGRFAYVVNKDTHNVSVIDVAAHEVTATIPTGVGPTSIAVLPNGRQAYVSNNDSGTLTILELAG